MPSLIILGNLNQHTFANAITAADIQSKKLFSGNGIERIFVIHTPESEEKLTTSKEWVAHLKSLGINTSEIAYKIIDEEDNQQALTSFVKFIEFILNGIRPLSDEIIVDLTNGATFYKNLLAIVCYLLNIKHQYMIDVPKLFSKTPERGFLNPDILGDVYSKAPDSSQMDAIAYLDLAKVIRYKNQVARHAAVFEENFGSSVDKSFFYDNLIHSIEIKFKAEQRGHDNSLYRIATGSIAASLEEMIHQMHLKYIGIPQEKATFGTKINILQDKITSLDTPGFDKEFLNIFNKMILYLRNQTIHKTRDLDDLEKFKAELMTQMAFPFIDYYLSFIDKTLSKGSIITNQLRKIEVVADGSRERWFIGLDGDNTGQMLEEMFARNESSKSFKALSNSVEKGLKKVTDYLKPFKPEIIFNAGDDLLFQAEMTSQEIATMKEIYKNAAPGHSLTCCIGYGRTIYEAYLAMSMAKATPGKDTVVGVTLV